MEVGTNWFFFSSLWNVAAPFTWFPVLFCRVFVLHPSFFWFAALICTHLGLVCNSLLYICRHVIQQITMRGIYLRVNGKPARHNLDVKRVFVHCVRHQCRRDIQSVCILTTWDENGFVYALQQIQIISSWQSIPKLHVEYVHTVTEGPFSIIPFEEMCSY